MSEGKGIGAYHGRSCVAPPTAWIPFLAAVADDSALLIATLAENMRNFKSKRYWSHLVPREDSVESDALWTRNLKVNP